MPRGTVALLNTARLVSLISQIGARSRAAVDTAADNIQGRAAQLAPLDTGSLVSSIYVTNGDTSDYAQRAGEARSRNSAAEILEEINPDLVISLFGSGSAPYIAVIGVAVGHGIFNEFGTRFMSPQPFMLPAVEAERDAFAADMSDIANI